MLSGLEKQRLCKQQINKGNEKMMLTRLIIRLFIVFLMERKIINL